MRSSWEETRAISKYHFNTEIMDPRWDNIIGLGYIMPTWHNDIQKIIEDSKPATWATRGYKGKDNPIPGEDLDAEEYDLTRVGADPNKPITHLGWDLPISLQRISNLFALENCMNRIHVQMPGELWNLHIDKLYKWCPEDPSKVMRIFVHLTSWKPGQFWELGNYHYNRWTAGEVFTFDWQHVPHSTANAGHHPRVTLQLTGVKTENTENFLHILRNTNIFK